MDLTAAEWVERIDEDLEYAHGEVRAMIVDLQVPADHPYWRRTDYLFQQVRNHLAALHRALSGEGEYVPPTVPAPNQPGGAE